MDPHAHRDTVRQLAADFGWLEGHCQRQPGLGAHTAHLRMAAALTRNVVGPAVERQPARPLFVAVVGGAGAGKSTVVNFLCGSVVVAANPQAGFTRHPTACVPAAAANAWPSYLGFLGPLARLTETRPADLDEDVYQVSRVPPTAAGAADPMTDFVVWDCPDMTTWAATGYVGRLMEVVGLADVVVYVASDERYNDEVPTQFLHHVVRAGKAVVVCLTKMREADARALADHFRKDVLGRLPKAAGGLPVVAVPGLPKGVLADPGGAGVAVRVALWNAILALCPTPEAARARTVANAVAYLETAGTGLLDVARADLAELDAWRALVAAGKDRFEQRYRQEYLAGEAFRRFDRTRDQVLALLDLPGPGKAVSATLSLLRLPYKYARDFVAKVVARPELPAQPERVVCTMALAAWLDTLQAEALRRAGSHPVWAQVVRTFDGGLKGQTMDAFDPVFRAFEVRESDELDQAAGAVPNYLTAHPVALNLARFGAVGLDLAAAGVTLDLTWPPGVYQLLLVPLAVSASRQAVELAVRAAVDGGRARVRSRRESLVATHLSGPLEARLAAAPAAGGSDLETLQRVLKRVPEAVKSLAALTRAGTP